MPQKTVTVSTADSSSTITVDTGSLVSKSATAGDQAVSIVGPSGSSGTSGTSGSSGSSGSSGT